MASSLQLVPRVLAAATLALALGYTAFVLTRSEQGFVTRLPDDTYYYLQIVRWRAELGVFTFDGGQTTTSGFHPLWAYLLLPLVRVCAENGRVLIASAAGLSALIALLTAGVVALRAWRVREHVALPALAICVSSYAFLNGAVSGMEWSLCVALGALLFGLLLGAGERPRARLIALFVVGALGSLARSDFGGVPAACLAAALFCAWRFGARLFVLPALTALAGAVCGLGATLLHNRSIAGDWLQASARVKAEWGAAAGWSPFPVLHQFARSILYVPALPGQNKTELKLQLVRFALPLVAAAVVLALGLAWWQRERIRSACAELVPAERFAALAALFTSAVFLLVYSSNPVGVQSWYTAHIMAPAFLLLCVGLRLARLSGLALATLLVAGNVGLFLATKRRRKAAAVPAAFTDLLAQELAAFSEQASSETDLGALPLDPRSLSASRTARSKVRPAGPTRASSASTPVGA